MLFSKKSLKSSLVLLNSNLWHLGFLSPFSVGLEIYVCSVLPTGGQMHIRFVDTVCRYVT